MRSTGIPLISPCLRGPMPPRKCWEPTRPTVLLQQPTRVFERFEFEEIERIRAAVHGGSDPVCPRCGGRLDRTDVPAREDVSYVRHRFWLICAPCGAMLVMDRPRTPPP